MNDNRKQLRMLHHLARREGFRSINLWAKANMAEFCLVAESWRELMENIL